jgi:oxaloacetate decarboxylase gamma subunit
MQGDIVSQGVELMLYGMGTVVVFLALLVVMTSAMSMLVMRFFPEARPVIADKAPGRIATGDDPQLVAAISAAIKRHRTRHK